MPTYTYKARDTGGKRVTGTMEAVSKTELADKLHRMGYLTTQVAESLPGIRIDSIWEPFRGISTEDMIIFNVQLSNLINAGIPLLASLGTLSKQVENKRLRGIVGEISRSLEAGGSFSEALTPYPRVFSKLFISMVRAGEASGKLDTILTRLAVFAEQEADLKQKIRGALLYPTILLAAGIAVSLYIVTVLIPQFAEIFLRVGLQLPWPTLLLYRVGTALKQFWQALILGLLAFWVGFGYYAATRKGKLQVDQLKLKLPIMGSLFQKAAISRFARTFGMLIESGVPILTSLEMMRDVVGNEVLARIIDNVRVAVEKGEKITESLKVSEGFPADAVQMISVGEETGNLDLLLNKIADFYDRSLGYTIRKLTTVLEPLLLGMMGCLVGFIMASMLLPIFDMVKILRH